jgi:septum formation protein
MTTETTPRPRIVLASGSPRRRQLLELVGLPHRLQPARIDEVRHPGEEAVEFALRAARDKAMAVTTAAGGLPVLGSDTVVEIDGEALGKPLDLDDARRMLRRLSGRSHRVHTGVTLVLADRCEGLVDTASVRFLHLTDAVIDWYVATGEPMDKAGAYAVQGRGGLLVDGVDGSPHTVVGLPIHRLPELFARLDLDFWSLLE